ncbi:xanthine dehydrogenase family protein molybdopterin-binding subunit [Litoribacter populi]|uniref:xanthine dehydrogenase family protein molybdopterin-binding subunit n=1 Tax=Litoribacter populi TaxID=2598460 RepID=UPI001180269D|nr:xanthine dehydrogenase family protein molybdopterin-binding subunit [Litoribacter populi]
MAATKNGEARNRVDGYQKVTGQAKYAGEWQPPGLLHGVVLNSTIAKGKILHIETEKALQLDGVLQVFTHENRPPLAHYDKSYQDLDAPPGTPFRPLFDNKILFNMQPIALVVAESLELARYAASLVTVNYEKKQHEVDFEKQLQHAFIPKDYKAVAPPEPWGSPAEAYHDAKHRLSATYTHPSQHHHPMEPHASTVLWEENGRITVYDKIQGALNSQKYLMGVFGLAQEDVRVLSPFVGGAFGSGLRPQYQLFLATMAALELRCSVRVVLSRPQMFSFGHRPKTHQRFSLAASEDGQLQAMIQEVYGETSRFEDYSENVISWPLVLYNCANASLSYKLVGLDVYTPLDMRAPGGASGIFALECAMDELAYQVGMNPLDFRLKNYAEKDQFEDKPFSSKELRECFRQGAEKFGWKNRPNQPRTMQEGHELIGWGLANGAWEANQKPAHAKAVLAVDGKLTVSSATADIGTGTYTIMSQVAAETMGLELEQVTFKLGDSSLPKAPLEGGSATASSVGSAVREACRQLGKKLLELAQEVDGSPLKDIPFWEVEMEAGQLRLKKDPTKAMALTDILHQNQKDSLAATIDSQPSEEQDNYAIYSHSAVFVEVRVDEALGTVRVSRMVNAIAGGRILNPKTAKSQILGGMVWGVGMALEEESVMDTHYGRFINHDLAGYHIPVNADLQELDVIFVEEEDDIVNPIGAKGLGEVGNVAVAPAIVNAIFHATGKRFRDLPVTVDKILENDEV